ncbi:hypothetical protein GCT19_04185 [Paraburkholderia sp. CNPSo 3155]|uniref:hypothetical protein n=1 Tax=Paraburkholderia atlantica TaxID=2654982 RepID=UPI00128D842D|nr:hypothetical protein [Paraburkholderia atlantica]MPW04855.1 hypothetical protein [Paraburkholderia atlantica]
MGRKPKEERPDPRWAARADDQLIEDLFDFDFGPHMDAVRRGKRDDDDYTFKLLVWFARDRENMPEWALEEIRLRFLSVLRGASWREAFPLPWLPAPTDDEIRSHTENKKLKVGWAVYRVLCDNPKMSVAKAAAQVCEAFGVEPHYGEVAYKELRDRFWIGH